MMMAGSAHAYIIDSGTESVGTGDTLYENQITIGQSASATLDVDGGAVANAAGTGPSSISLAMDGSALRVRNGGTVLGNVTGDAAITGEVAVNSGGTLNGSVTLHIGSVTLDGGSISGSDVAIFEAGSLNIWNQSTLTADIEIGSGYVTIHNQSTVTGAVVIEEGDLLVNEQSAILGATDYISLYESGSMGVRDASTVDTERIFLNRGILEVTGESAVSASDAITLAEGNLIVSGASQAHGGDVWLLDGGVEIIDGSRLTSALDIQLDDGNLAAQDSQVTAFRNLFLQNGGIAASEGSTLLAGRNIALLNGNLEAEDSEVRARRDIILAEGDLDTRADSVIGAGRDIALHQGNLLADDSLVRARRDFVLGNGYIYAANDSVIRAGRDIRTVDGAVYATNASDIRAGRDLILSRSGISSENGSMIRADRNIEIHIGAINARNASVVAGGDITLNDAGIFIYEGGTVEAEQGSIRTSNVGIFAYNGSRVLAGGDLFVDNGWVTLSNSTIHAGRNPAGGGGSVRFLGSGADFTNSTLEADAFIAEGGHIELLRESVILADTSIRNGLLTVDETSRIEGDTLLQSGAAAWIEGTMVGDVRLNGPSGNRYGGGLYGQNATITGNLASNGIVSPGAEPGAIGRVNVGGNFLQGPEGSVIADIHDRKNYDRIVVGGSAVIDGGDLHLNHAGYKPRRNDTLRLISAADGVEVLNRYSVHHAFANDTMLEAKVRYRGHAVELFIEQLAFTSQAETPNQHAVAKALDHAAQRDELDALFETLNYTNREAIPSLLERLSPEALSTIFTLGLANAQTQNINIERRLDDVRRGSRGFSANGLALTTPRGTINHDGMPVINDRDGLSLAGFDGRSLVGKEFVAPVIEENSPWGFFATGTGEWTDVETTHQARGGSFSSGGVTVGADYRVNGNFVVGLFGGYAHSKADLASGGDITADGGRGGLYGTYFNDGFYVNALASGAYNHYKIHRDTLGGTARGTTDGGQFDALLGAGYDFHLGSVTLGPVASVQYSYVGFDRFEESGSDAPLNVSRNHQDSLRTLLGAKIAASWNVGTMVFRPEVRAQWKHEYLDREGAIESGFVGSNALFTVHGPQIGRDSLVLDAGAALDLNRNLSLFAWYTGELGRHNVASHGVNGGVRVRF